MTNTREGVILILSTQAQETAAMSHVIIPKFFSQFSDEQLRTFYRTVRSNVIAENNGYTPAEYDEEAAWHVETQLPGRYRKSVKYAWFAFSDFLPGVRHTSEDILDAYNKAKKMMQA